MASDLSSGCTDDIDIFEEKEEGELSLEDVSSSEESHPNYRSDFRAVGRCVNCMGMRMCAPWCPSARAARKTHRKLDAAHGKENRRHAKDPSGAVPKHMVATLQEKNDDLVPISSDSDMEIVGLPGNSKQPLPGRSKSAKVRKKKKKKRSHSSVLRIEGSLSPPQVETYLVDVPVVKKVHSSRSHHREASPPRFALERPLARSPPRRHRATRALKSRSPPRRSRSPAARPNLADRKSSPRKQLRSPPRRSPPRSPVRPGGPCRATREPRVSSPPETHVDVYAAKPLKKVRRVDGVGSAKDHSSLFRTARDRASSPPETHDNYATQLLKKVRRLESVNSGSTKDLTKSKEHSSLKEKLSNMMKNQTEGQEKPSSRKREIGVVALNDGDKNAANGAAAAAAETDEEDDIELLRRRALETKQKKSENKVEETRAKSESDGDDVEANQLRILALKSAWIKKHEKRVTRGVKSRKPVRPATRVESPFNESLFDDIQISGEDEEEETNLKSPAARFSPAADDEIHSEDMDLDTDVEREKENDFLSPYSPTDDLSRGILVDDEISTLANDNNNEEEKSEEREAGDVRRGSPDRSACVAGVDTPYSPSAPTETPIMGKIVLRRRLGESEKIALENGEISSSSGSSGSESPSYYLPGVDTPFSPPATPAKNLPTTDSPMSPTGSPDSPTGSPTSPTEAPVLDPVLFPIFPDLPAIPPEAQREADEEEEKNAALKIGNPAVLRDLESAALEETTNEAAGATRQESANNSVALEEEKHESPALPLGENCFRPIDALMDKLPEVDLDGSPLVPVSRELEGAELIIPIENSPEVQDPEVEPLYLQSLSEVANKIPTLANRTLVPALILKTNKQLQQPLPQKKVDSHAEPSFKSAEMRPVSVEPAPVKSATLFKPIKLCPIAKKPQVMTTAAAAFSASFGDESLTETKSDEESAKPEAPTVRDAKIATISSAAAEKSQKVDEEEAKKSGAKNRKGGRLRNKKRFSADAESPSSSKESSAGRAKSGEAARKAKSDAENASNPSERVTRASIRSSLVKSWENFRETVEKPAEDKQRRASVSKGDKKDTSKKEASEDGERKKKKSRRSKKNLKRLSSSSAGKSSDLDATKSSEQSADKCGSEEQTEPIKNDGESGKVGEEAKKVEEAERKRRCSVDEDEEALRALLLASLPKRTKPVEASQSTAPSIPAAKISQPSDGTTEANAENSASKLAESTSTDSAFTSANPSAPSSQSSSAIFVAQKVEGATTMSAEAAGQIFASESNVEASPATPRKRANSVVVKGPPKKIVKKALPVLASTKVVNNAKKYQNALLQKKINLQRAAMTYGAQNGSRNITLNNLKNCDAARPSSPKITAASKTQRLVINLGSDTDSEAELENQPARPVGSDSQTEIRKPLAIPTTDFEKSVVQFLKDQRKKLESGTVSKSLANTATTAGKAAANSASPAAGKLSGLYNTPLAVRRHLPMSKQEEYRRLKQQIMERERQKLQKTIENGSQNPSMKSPCTPPGPLSPASPIGAAQKSQTGQKISSVASQLATGAAAIKEKTPESSLVVQKKMELAKANENRPVASITKVSKTIVPAIPSKQLTKPLASSTKVNSNIPNNVPFNASVPKVPTKIPPKTSFGIPATNNFPSNTSTPKSQSSIASKTYVSISSRAPPPLARAAEEKRGNFLAEAPSTSKKFPVESSTSFASRNADRWSLGTISVPSLPATSVGRRSSNPTEMLTIQIPNDKIQTDRAALTGISKRESSSPPNGRNAGMLKILTKEQLNSRFVQIKVKQGPSGRTVTVGGSPLSQDDANRSASSSPIPRVLPEGRSDKTICCDSSLIVNESTITRRGDQRSVESVIGDSEASTFVLSRSEGNSRRNGTGDSDASTFVVDREKDSTVDSAASTFVMVHNSECRESPGATRAEEHEDGGLATNARAAKPTKVQVKEEWEKIRSDVRNELEILTALPTEQQRVILMESQENLVAKRNMILDDLTAMSGCLRQWEVEREIQTKLIAEVRRLREQLRTAERHLHEQRRQMNGMGPKVSKAHEKINQGRRECYKLSRICHGLGTNVIGDDYKVPDTGAQQLNERMKEVAVHTRQLSKKKVPPLGATSNSRDTSSPASSTGSDTVSECSLVERPPNSTTPTSETASVEEATNSLTSEIDLDSTKLATENLETTNVDSPRPNPIPEKVAAAPAEKVDEEKSSDRAEKNAQTKSGEGDSETNAETVEIEKINELLEKNAQTKEKEASSSCECNANDSSDIPATNLISEDRFEDIPTASTSKFYPHGQLMSSDEKPHVKTKIGPYKSVLTHLKASRSVNPEGILCPYELMGTCSDGDCQFYHLDPGHCQ